MGLISTLACYNSLLHFGGVGDAKFIDLQLEVVKDREEAVFVD